MRSSLFSLVVPIVLVAGCMYQPKLTTYYEEGCTIEFRRMTMTLEQQQQLLYGDVTCSGADHCKALFALRFIVAAAALPVSAIVSGSIVVVGNTIYWLQEQGIGVRDFFKTNSVS